MVFDLTTANLLSVNILPSTLEEEIAQNVLTILKTVQGEVPLDREFGIDKKMLDAPIAAARAKLTAKIVSAVAKFEPRARVTDVFYRSNELDGLLYPVVRIKIKR